MWKELTTMPHVVFGVFGILCAVWVAVEAANSSEMNWRRLKLASIGTTLFLWISYLIGGWWYVVYYGAAGSNSDKSIILAGPWKWSHSFFMETKEHVFFMLILLSILLPIVIFRNPVFKERKIRNLTIVIALTIAVLGLGMEGFGAMISKGVKMSLMGGR
jgi:phosphoglycerol transferase MdoB-like AlkP superfamily enzyme